MSDKLQLVDDVRQIRPTSKRVSSSIAPLLESVDASRQTKVVTTY